MGYMGVGKTTVGRILSESLQMPFYDLDEVIENRSGQTIPQIFSIYGEPAFRAVESSALYWTTKRTEAVIATGGGAPCYNQNMHLIKQHGFSIYLKMDPSDLHKRLLSESSTRPRIANFDTSELMEFIQQELKFRDPIYQEADLIVDANRPLYDLKQDLLEYLRSNIIL